MASLRTRAVALLLGALLLGASMLGACAADEPTRPHAYARARANPPASTTPADTGPGWEQRRGHEALGLVRYPWERLGYRIHFRAERQGVVALNFPSRKIIEVYVRPGLSLVDLAHVIAHEIGHAHDLKYLTDRQRNEWKKLRGFAEVPGWMEGDAASDFGRPGGDFAEVFAYWAIGSRGIFKSELAPRPTADQLRQLEPYLRPR